MTRQTFNNIVDQNYKKMFLIACRMLNNREEAEDVVQEVFMKMWGMRSKLDEYSEKGALAIVMTRNICIDLLRKRKHFDNRNDVATLGDSVQDKSPFDQMISNEIKVVITNIIDGLPPLYRDAIKMREIQGLTYEEISDLSNTNINTLRVTISRARSMIKEQYLKYNHERGRN
jgi:RNA polymerase sigma-70 factor (ECF subfamily)